MAVRAKFKVVGKSETISGGHGVKLEPVTSGSEENKEFYKYTPYGVIELNTINDAASDQFILGKEYYIDFTLAE